MAIETDEVYGEIRGIIGKQLGLGLDEISHDATFDSLGTDSLGRLEVIRAIDISFNTFLPREFERNDTTVGQLLNYVQEQMSLPGYERRT